jgi:hypothetical protein
VFVNRKEKGEIGYTQVERESPVTIVKISENPIIGGGLFVCVFVLSRHRDGITMTRKEGEKNIPVKETIRERERNGYNRIAPKRLKGAVAVTVKALFPSRARLDDTELLPFFFRLKFCRVTAGE